MQLVFLTCSPVPRRAWRLRLTDSSPLRPGSSERRARLAETTNTTRFHTALKSAHPLIDALKSTDPPEQEY
eukprot:5834676-Pyramimonas_sp.AAC.1